jgi:hypothetical protein
MIIDVTISNRHQASFSFFISIFIPSRLIQLKSFLNLFETVSFLFAEL